MLGGPKCSIALAVLGSGEFGNEPEVVHRACCLAHSAYRAAGGMAGVSVVLDSTGTEGVSEVGPPGARWATKDGASEVAQRKTAALNAELELWFVIFRFFRVLFVCFS